jgi:hypothetical protein
VVPGKARVPARTALARLAYAAVFIGSFCTALAGAFVHHNPWLAFLTLAVSGIGLGWALFDRDRQFLYDRLAGTRLVLVDRNLTV